MELITYKILPVHYHNLYQYRSLTFMHILQGKKMCSAEFWRKNSGAW